MRARPVAPPLLLAALLLAGLGLGLSGAFAAGEQKLTLSERVLPGEGYPNGRYLYLPFDVPAGVSRVTVKVSKDDRSGQARIGAGLFDQRGPGYQSGGFRGIYGEERSEFFVAADDATVSPTYVPDLAHACLDLLVDGERGIWHLASPGAVTWADLARRAAELAALDPALVEGRPTAALGLAAPRPPYAVLGSGRGVLLPPLEDALARYFEERGAQSAAEEAPGRAVAAD